MPRPVAELDIADLVEPETAPVAVRGQAGSALAAELIGYRGREQILIPRCHARRMGHEPGALFGPLGTRIRRPVGVAGHLTCLGSLARHWEVGNRRL